MPDFVVDGLDEAADQAQPQQEARKGQQPSGTGGQPPRRQPGQKVDLRKGQLVAVRALPALPDGQQEEGQRRKAVGPQQAQRGPLAALGPVEAGGFHRQQLVGQLCGIAFGQAEGQGALFRFAHRVKGDPAGPGQAEIEGPLDGQRRQRGPAHRPVEPEQQLPVEAEGAVFVQRPAACAEDDPAHAADQQKQDDVLPQRGTQGLPVALKQHVDQRHKVEHQRFAEDLEGRKGVQMLFGHRHGASSARA